MLVSPLKDKQHFNRKAPLKASGEMPEQTEGKLSEATAPITQILLVGDSSTFLRIRSSTFYFY